MRRSFNHRLLGLIAGTLGTLSLSTGASAYTEKTLYKFCQETKCADGARPEDLLMDQAGNLYGMTFAGPYIDRNNFGYGTVFEFMPGTGSFQTLYKFCSLENCADGKNPDRTKLVIDTKGNLYGVTSHGGAVDWGVAFELVHTQTGWLGKILYTFCSKNQNCTDGALPQAGLTYAGASSGAPYDGVSPLYGTTRWGGAANKGTVFTLTKKKRSGEWKEKVLYSLCSQANCADGSLPEAPVTLDTGGNLFGTVSFGGANNWGTVFELQPAGNGAYTQSVLYSFCAQENCADGQAPVTGVSIDAAGNLLGVASEGGQKNDGVLYQLSPQGNGSWQYNALADFNKKNGAGPVSLIVGHDGSLFGTTYGGGTRDKGTVFKYSDGAIQTIYNVCQEPKCPEGARPVGGLVQDSAGNLFGNNEIGGIKNGGTIFELVADKPAHHAK